MNASSFTRFLIKFLSTGFFAGYLPLIPGTFGSLVGLVFYYAVSGNAWLYAGSTLAVVALGFLVSGKMERESGKKDPKCVVIDEVAGMLVALWGVPGDIRMVMLGFVFFRLLDSFKPYPAWQLQGMRGSAGIMIDDLVAGVYTNLVLQAVWLFKGASCSIS